MIGPRGAVRVLAPEHGRLNPAGATSAVSSEIQTHLRPGAVRIHHAALGPDDAMLTGDEDVLLDDTPDHDEISRREQLWLLEAIRRDLDLSRHWTDAVNSLRIVLAADESIRTRRAVDLL